MKRGVATAAQDAVLHGSHRGRPNTPLHVAGIALVFVAVGMAITTVVGT